MSKRILAQLLICIFVLGLFLYAYIDKQNDLTELTIQIPKLSKELKKIHEENINLIYAINRFENPRHLIELSRSSEFSHLKTPFINEVVIISEEIKE